MCVGERCAHRNSLTCEKTDCPPHLYRPSCLQPYRALRVWLLASAMVQNVDVRRFSLFSYLTGCICIIDCTTCSVLQRVTVHNKDISSISCVLAPGSSAADALNQVVMASACKAGVVAVTILGGSSFSLNAFKSKVIPHLYTFSLENVFLVLSHCK